MMQEHNLEHALLGVLNEVLGQAQDPVTLLHAPDFQGKEWDYVKECIDTAWVSSIGKFVDRFERMLEEYCGAKHAIVVSNGTSALHVALVLAGVKPGDEVIVPALSFVATANAVVHAGAVPHFVDSSHETLGMDPARLADHLASISTRSGGELRNRLTGRRISAVVPMHTFGFPVDLDALVAVAERFGLTVVEDAAESLGSLHHGQHTGTWGRLGVLSFNGNKIITTGGGGAKLTNDDELGRRAKHLTTTGKMPHRWEFIHDEVAWNYRLPNLNAALGCAQMEQLPGIVDRKRTLAMKYRAALSCVEGLSFVGEPAASRSNYWLVCIQIARADREVRDSLLAAVNDAGYQCRPVWRLLSSLSMFQGCPRAELEVASELESSLINVPSSSLLCR